MTGSPDSVKSAWETMTRTQKGFTVWFTGLPSAGKTTLAQLLADELTKRGHEVEVLDGDALRRQLSRGLGFTKQDRDENIRRVGFVCRLLTRHGTVAIAAAISPYRAVRDEVRAEIGNFVEVYVQTSRSKRASRGTLRASTKKPSLARSRDSPAWMILTSLLRIQN